MDVIRRTFEALNYPKGSEERARLNRDKRTSEYGLSMRYMTSGDLRVFRTKREAFAHVDAGPWCAACHGHWVEHGDGHDFNPA